MKKIILAVLILIPCFCTSSANNIDTMESNDINLIINSEEIKLTSPTLISNSSILFPLRELCNILNIPDDNIVWEGKEQSVLIINNEKNLKLTLNSNIAKINGSEFMLPATPILYKNKTYIPLRLVSEFFDCFIVWDTPSKTVFVKNFADYSETYSFFISSNNAVSNIQNIQIDTINEIANTSFGSSIYIDSEKNIILEKNILTETWQESDITLLNSPTSAEINYLSTLACGMNLNKKLSTENYYVYTGFFPSQSGKLSKAKLYIDTSTRYLIKLVSETPTDMGLLTQNVMYSVNTGII